MKRTSISLLVFLLLLGCSAKSERGERQADVIKTLQLYKNAELGLCFVVNYRYREGYLAHVPCPGEKKPERKCPEPKECDKCYTDVAIHALLASLQRYLIAQGVKGTTLEALMNIFRLTAKEAELKAKLGVQ